MSTCYLILGPKRTGTSLVAHQLVRAGVDMGPDWIDPDPGWRPLGLHVDWELHQAFILSTPSHPAYSPEGELRMRAQVARRAIAPRWGVKDHACFECLDLFRRIVLEAGCELKIVRCTRRLLSSAASLVERRRGATTTAEAVAELRAEADAIENFCAAVPEAEVIDFDDVMANPRGNASKLARLAGGDPDDLASLVDAQWRRH